VVGRRACKCTYFIQVPTTVIQSMSTDNAHYFFSSPEDGFFLSSCRYAAEVITSPDGK